MERTGSSDQETIVEAGDISPVTSTSRPHGRGVAARLPARVTEAFELLPGHLETGVLVLCDHASNRIPPEYGNLGLPPGELARHIAWDIGAAGVARRLAERLKAPAILSRFSRLLVDPNRGLDDPTLVMRLSDGAVIPGNAHIDNREKARRVVRFWQPYDAAIRSAIDAFLATGVQPVLVSVHSFTPTWRGVPRPWHAAVLHDPRDPDFSRAVLDALSCEPHLVIGDNEPYRGGLPGDTLDRHGLARGLPHVLVELRQDLVADAAGQAEWAERLARALQKAMTRLSLPKRS